MFLKQKTGGQSLQ